MVISTVALGAAISSATFLTSGFGSLSGPVETLRYEPSAQGQNAFNPDMSLVFNFGSRLVDSMVPPVRRAAMREIEWGIAADVDPYMRAEAYIAFASPLDEDEGEVDVEEAFGSYTGLSAGTDIRVGKLAGAIGRINRNHVDQLDFFDYPLLVTSVLGEEGLRAPGVSWAYLFPGDQFNEITIEALVPDDGPLFAGSDAGKPLWVGHYRTFFDFTQDLSAQLGFSYGTGPMGGETSSVYGADFVAKLRPEGTGRSAVFEAEALWYEAGGGAQRNGHFASLAIELSKRVWAGARYDYVQLPDGSDTLRAFSTGLTLKMTEFQLIRLEWQNVDSNAGASRNQLMLQVQFLIGPHRAHKY
jgi:hypothetical protein